MNPTLNRATSIPGAWLTPRQARTASVHRWFVFPHSYAPELVSWLIDELQPDPHGTLLDPFCGAGTTLVEGERYGLHSVGVDLLPLAVLATRAKLVRPTRRDLADARRMAVGAARAAAPRTPRSQLLRRAFTPTAFGRLAASLGSVAGPAGDCVRLATLAIAPRFSALVADGGWLRETTPADPPRLIPAALEDALSQMEADLPEARPRPTAMIRRADSRALPLADRSVDVVITSPPYPNRHDYTRVFGVELELGFALGDSVKQLRYEALRSHPEARHEGVDKGYERPAGLRSQVSEVAARHPDPRVPRMLDGYFTDIFLVLRELARVVRRGGSVALVVGNAQYMGVSIPVDEHLVRLATQVGFSVIDSVTLRLRGNSAQQMAVHGRQPSRESAVLLRR